MARYAVLIDGDEGAYGVVVPDLPGCTAMGKTLDEAMQNAADALRDWVEVTEAAGEEIPAARSLRQVTRDRDVAAALAEGSVLAAVPLIRHSGRPVKANLSIDSGTLAAIDEEATRRHLTRSNFIEIMAHAFLPKLA